MQQFQIRNDPVNSLLDMLPGYALEMRSQDIQRKQERRRVQLAEKTQFDLNQRQIEQSDRALELSKRRERSLQDQEEWHNIGMEQEEQRKKLARTEHNFITAQMEAESDLHNAFKEHETFKTDHADLFNQYQAEQNAKTLRGQYLKFTGQSYGRTFEEFLSERTGDKKAKEALIEYNKLPGLEMEFPEFEFEPNTLLNFSAYQAWHKAREPLMQDKIDELFIRYGGLPAEVESDPRISLQGKPRPTTGKAKRLMDMLTGVMQYGQPGQY